MGQIEFKKLHLFPSSYDDLSFYKESDVKLFKIDFSKFYDSIPFLVSHLDPDELNRAKKYHFKKHANQFIICRVLLKMTLAYFSGLKLQQIRIRKDENNKPYFFSQEHLKFNISHSKNFAIIALGHSSLGIDLEFMDRSFHFKDLLQSTFSEEETRMILKSSDPLEVFFQFWTRKEAIVKAIGKGIDDYLQHVPALSHKNKAIFFGQNETDHFSVYSFRLNHDYMGALALLNYKNFLDKCPIFDVPIEIGQWLKKV